MNTWNLELTDTFGGEANYCWVHRETIEFPESANDEQIIATAVSVFNLPAIDRKDCRVEEHGDSFAIYYEDDNIVLFIDFDDS